MYCPRCGKRVSGTPFCPYCGVRLPSGYDYKDEKIKPKENPVPPPAQPPKNNSGAGPAGNMPEQPKKSGCLKWLIIIIAAIALIFAAVNKDNDSGRDSSDSDSSYSSDNDYDSCDDSDYDYDSYDSDYYDYEYDSAASSKPSGSYIAFKADDSSYNPPEIRLCFDNTDYYRYEGEEPGLSYVIYNDYYRDVLWIYEIGYNYSSETGYISYYDPQNDRDGRLDIGSGDSCILGVAANCITPEVADEFYVKDNRDELDGPVYSYDSYEIGDVIEAIGLYNPFIVHLDRGVLTGIELMFVP